MILVLIVKLVLCSGVLFDPQNMEHMEQFLKIHTPQRNDYLNFINPGKPSGFECTFEE